MDTKTIAREAAVAKLHKPDISDNLAKSLANDYKAFQAMNPEATLEEFLQALGITQYRDLYVAAVGHFVTVDDSSRGGMVMEAFDPKLNADHPNRNRSMMG